MTKEEAIVFMKERLDLQKKEFSEIADYGEALTIAISALESIDGITDERDAAVKDLSRLDDNCFCCKWWKRDEADRRLFRCKCHSVCCADSNDEKDPDLWEWRGIE